LALRLKQAAGPKGEDMLASFVNTLASPFVEIGILIVLLIAFLTHRKDPRLAISGISFVRVLILLLIFFYLMFVWSSSVQPALRGISIFGMFIVNMVLLYNLILACLLRPYHSALTSMAQAPEKRELIQQVWESGKRFYYLRYAWSSLFSGANPFHFLREMAADRIRDDIKNTLRSYGVERRMLSLSTLVAYLKSQIASDTTLPADFQSLILQAIDDFAKHPYIQEHTNEFLRLATESPEDLTFPEWTAEFESAIKSPR
jgi:ABC-type transport system involved in multi-copper enzyme maturation permease subunit